MESLQIYNATELWQKETSLPSIPTFSQSIDNVMGNDGVQLSSLTELIGLPGSGKTQLWLGLFMYKVLMYIPISFLLSAGDRSLQGEPFHPIQNKSLFQIHTWVQDVCFVAVLPVLQLCASVQIPKVLGGLSAEAVYIDTNTNFTLHRFREILNASLSKCQRLLDVQIGINEDAALKKLHYVNAFGLEKFCAFMYNLPKFIEEHSHIKLIVIDSIAFPFKEGIPTKKRTGLLFRQMADLHRLAVEKQIAVVLTNEMSTRVGLSSGTVVGAMGDAWSHRCNKRLLLSTQYHGGPRLALLLKSNDAPNIVGRFQITDEGIRDIE